MNHYRDLTDAEVLVTPAFDTAASALDFAIESGEIIVLYGDAGYGKTFAVTTLLDEYPEVDRHYLDLPGRPSPKQIAAALAKDLTGLDQNLTLAGLTDLLLTLLGAKRRVIVVDEAQRIGHDGLEFLRHLHDEVWRSHNGGRGAIPFTLVLVGGNGCAETLGRYPMLRSRVSAWVGFERLSENEVVELMPQFHPLYANVDEDLLVLIDEEFARGNLRNWADFTRHAVALCARQSSPLTEEIIRNVFGWRNAA